MGPGRSGREYAQPSSQVKSLSTAEDAKAIVEDYIQSTRNPNLKLGKIEDAGDAFRADIVTQDNSLVDQVLQLVIHVQFCQLGEPADTFSVDDDLGDGARTIGYNRKLAPGSVDGVDAEFLVGNVPLVQQLLCLDAEGTAARTVNLDSCHGSSRIHCERALYKKLSSPT
jgi:hypothetical protein